MMELFQGAAAGIAANLGSEKIKKTLLKEELEDWEKFLTHFPDEWDKFHKAMIAMAGNANHSALSETINLWGFPSNYTINMRGRQHLSLFCLANFNLYAQVKQIGYITLAPKAGWNTLDLTDGSELALPAGTAGPVAVLLMYADVNLGTAIGVQ